MTSLEAFEKQDSLFEARPRNIEGIPPSLRPDDIPETLKRAALRLELPPSYALVGVYRLFTDRNLWKPTWDKCKHGVARGVLVGAVWAVLTFGIQERFIRTFLRNSPRITGLSNATVFGYPIPFDLSTYAALIYMGDQLTTILRFFLSKNIRIARERVWQHTVASRGKGPDFFQPYVEEWDVPPVVDSKEGWLEKLVGGWMGMFVLKRVVLAPLALYPLVGTVVSAWFRALGTSRQLHRRYFEAKKMTQHEIAVFMEERKWDYRTFGFVAALLEGLPIIGIVFTISNRIGAAMWAFDLEKHQHWVRQEKLQKAK
ncbi:hypothetical protein DFP72DRAFT_902106 [Ephemerocybe angulata]|uniref:Uncharacterized protein n=1 Tax=Ephemerocybe angulata TaxID=980116 RepID=A0A8H6HTZ3_9AGAR|nr:hypothetical protein DFP72DRAFT_902106 [Tulosesus angulatus]